MFLLEHFFEVEGFISYGKLHQSAFSSDSQTAVKQMRELYVVTIVINVAVHKKKLGSLRYISPRENGIQFLIIWPPSAFVAVGSKKWMSLCQCKCFPTHLSFSKWADIWIKAKSIF